MFGFFQKDPVKKLEKEYSKKMEQARDIQRTGDLKRYAEIIDESEKIAQEIQRLSKKD